MSLSRKETLFFAKRHLADSIHRAARVEGCNVTFPQTQTILDGVNVGAVTLDDVQTILNLRDAWRFLLADLDQPLDVAYLCELNAFVSRNESLAWGVLRTGTVGISGTNYRPPMPTEESVAALLVCAESATIPAAMDVFCRLCTAQPFWDGNKRTATLAANQILLKSGTGLFSVREEAIETFNTHLLSAYNTGETTTFARWLAEHCIHPLQ